MHPQWRLLFPWGNSEHDSYLILDYDFLSYQTQAYLLSVQYKDLIPLSHAIFRCRPLSHHKMLFHPFLQAFQRLKQCLHSHRLFPYLKERPSQYSLSTNKYMSYPSASKSLCGLCVVTIFIL